jgi:orotidine-5'-phosphate decarboxylase
MNFEDRLRQRISIVGSGLCVGLDPRPVEGQDIREFLLEVVKQTAPYAAAFKPNIAYFEAMGSKGIALLEDVLTAINGEVPVVLDVKRSDIGETCSYYAKAYFERWNVDAITVNPLLGFDSVEPFLGYEGKGVYLLGVTSNPGAKEFLLKKIDGRYTFEHIQDMHKRAANLPGSIGLVLGLTNVAPEILERVADLPLLVPGLGAQGGDLRALQVAKRKAPILINASRGITYREPEKSFAVKAQEYAEQIRQAMR